MYDVTIRMQTLTWRTMYIWCITHMDTSYLLKIIFYGHTVKPTARDHLFALVYAFNSLHFIIIIKGLFKNGEIIYT